MIKLRALMRVEEGPSKPNRERQVKPKELPDTMDIDSHKSENFSGFESEDDSLEGKAVGREALNPKYGRSRFGCAG